MLEHQVHSKSTPWVHQLDKTRLKMAQDRTKTTLPASCVSNNNRLNSKVVEAISEEISALKQILCSNHSFPCQSSTMNYKISSITK